MTVDQDFNQRDLEELMESQGFSLMPNGMFAWGDYAFMDVTYIHSGNSQSTRSEGYLRLDSIYVEQSFRGQNIGEDMILALHAIADHLDLRVRLIARPFMNGPEEERLEAWYKKLGYREAPESMESFFRPSPSELSIEFDLDGP
jgi:GNAT superfamily N-acetyltransferase